MGARFDKRIAAYRKKRIDKRREESIIEDPEEEPITEDSKKALPPKNLKKTLSLRRLKKILSLRTLQRTLSPTMLKRNLSLRTLRHFRTLNAFCTLKNLFVMVYHTVKRFHTKMFAYLKKNIKNIEMFLDFAYFSSNLQTKEST